MSIFFYFLVIFCFVALFGYLFLDLGSAHSSVSKLSCVNIPFGS